MANQTCPYWLELLKVAFPALLVIVGWIVVNSLTIKREKEKSRREMIAKSADELCVAVDKLFEYSNEYHSSERNKKLEDKIKITQSDISLRVSSLLQITDDKINLTNCLSCVVKLRQTVSGKHFEDEHSGSIGDGQIFEDIAEATLAMKRCLVELKHSPFSISSSASL